MLVRVRGSSQTCHVLISSKWVKGLTKVEIFPFQIKVEDWYILRIIAFIKFVLVTISMVSYLTLSMQ